MSLKFNEYKNLDLPAIGKEVQERWEKNRIFQKSIEQREEAEQFVFYEGPPSANGLPGIHHVMARTIKDLFCRYKTQKGFRVNRKAGWDTHGLPVEMEVEKQLGITKEDIGKKISIEEYNKECRKAVMKYKDIWDDLTRKMGYWVDLSNPYITYETKYIESVWWLLKRLYDKELLYKGYSVQPYSPAAGTGLSTHEVNMPGCYRDVTDTSIVAQFKVVRNEKSEMLFDEENEDVRFLAWTTTPWTLPANCAVAVGERIRYVKIKTFNYYTHLPVSVILANPPNIRDKYFNIPSGPIPDDYGPVDVKDEEGNFIGSGDLKTYKPGNKYIPWRIINYYQGNNMESIKYEQLMPYVQPDESEGEAFRVIIGDFVSTEEGTGIVHTASVFGADDFRVCKENKVPSILVKDEHGNEMPLVDKQGRFVKEVTDWPLRYLKPEYEDEETRNKPEYKSTDVLIAIKLKEDNKAFLVEKHTHSYPHCWRTDKPILYYPLDSWFVKTTAIQDRLIELNNTINWKPASTGTGRFGEWLNNLQDWNLSRSRYWGVPLPIWATEDKKEKICIGSIEDLKTECDKAVEAGVMESNPLAGFEPEDMSAANYEKTDLHRPFVDEVLLISPSGKPMKREPDLIDVWFDSGAMPYAQFHYPFENEDMIDNGAAFPADYIAEGVDQTRGWFYTLHAIAAMCFDSVAFKNVVSNGLVLDKKGQKMSKRIGNVVDPFETIEQYGADATRWYMITNAQPWDNLKFDLDGIKEVQRKFFRALYNSYAFYALYANIDGFIYSEEEGPVEKRAEIDLWIISKLNSLIRDVDAYYKDYEPTKAGRAIQHFVIEHLSNWYVRLCRRRFWKGEYSEDKIAAYQTLYRCLEAVARLSAPIAPFYMERLFTDLNSISKQCKAESVHLHDFPLAEEGLINLALEEKMSIAQQISSLVLALRKKEKIRVRQPLQKIMVPVLNEKFRQQLEDVKGLVLSEVNVKELEYLKEDSGVLVKKIKPNYKTIGPKYSKQMKDIAEKVKLFTQEDIAVVENEALYRMEINEEVFDLDYEDFEITSEDVPGWQVASEGRITVALDITITDDLWREGIARELVNKIQNMRKDKGLEVTDKINLTIQKHEKINDAINNNLNYICSETLASSLELVEKVKPEEGLPVEVVENIQTIIAIDKLN